MAEEEKEEVSTEGGGNFQQSKRPWHPYESLNYVLHMLVDKYHVNAPIYLTGNGTPSGMEVPDEQGVVHDEFRIEYVKNILKQLHKTMAEGIDVRGYFLWSLLDNFEWYAGYEPRYGIVRTEYETQRRIVKDSGHWYSQMIRDNGFED